MYDDVRFWDQLMVSNTPEGAVESLSKEEMDSHYVRLVSVAIDRQPSQMMAKGKALRRPLVRVFLLSVLLTRERTACLPRSLLPLTASSIASLLSTCGADDTI